MNKKFSSKLCNASWKIFEVLVNLPEAVIYGFTDRSMLKKYLSGEEELLGEKLGARLRSLKKGGYLQIVDTPNGNSIKLTKAGMIKALENPLDLRVDGKIRAVSYDIPEMNKIERRRFCRVLRRVGYIQLQKSLWVCKYSKADKIDLVIKELGLGDYVAYFIIERSNIQEHLNKLLARSEMARSDQNKAVE